jgi:hypothetical protein
MQLETGSNTLSGQNHSDARDSLGTSAEMDLRVRIYQRKSTLTEVNFSLSRREIETQTGLVFKVGNTYKLKGRIENLWDFEVERTVRRDRYFDIFIPPNFQSGFARGKRYHITLDSVLLTTEGSTQPREVRKPKEGLAATRLLKAYLLKRERQTIVFSLNKSWLENEMGGALETGKTYLINGKIGDICDFNARLQETGYSDDVKIYVPFDQVGRIRPGERYSIQVVGVREVVQTNEGRPRALDGYWDWKTVAAWVDTEGWYQSKVRAWRAIISQKEREPLDGIHDFLRGEEIPSVVYHTLRGYYELRTMGGIEAMAKFVLKTEPYIRTNNKREQIAKFKGMLSVETEYENVHKREARRILGIRTLKS